MIQFTKNKCKSFLGLEDAVSLVSDLVSAWGLHFCHESILLCCGLIIIHLNYLFPLIDHACSLCFPKNNSYF